MTTPSVDDPETLRRILSQAEALFLDFDGPICSAFAGMPASVVVDQLCVVLADGGYGEPPLDVEKSTDPFDVLKYAVTLGEVEAEYVTAAFTAHEVEAVATAKPTPGAHELLRSWSASGRPLAVVSNNSVAAIRTYLDLHGRNPMSR
jgi:phosphoglycolate phosphatase-like HAD superfamily hydrolase